jgi:hypothetical protein
MRLRWVPVLVTLLACGILPAAEPAIEFNRDIRPILADKCFKCHGPDHNQRKADLRLDLPEGAYADRGGYAAIDRNKPDESELIKRISAIGKEQMPPPRSDKKLTAEQIGLLKRWVAQGGEYQKHWSLIRARRQAVPETRNPIDRLIVSRLEKEELKLSPAADPRTLVRRLSFDLTGLPPTCEEVEAFAKDPSPAAYEKLVDRFLDSKHYGERMAVYWLDVVRYSDTAGYHSDNHRDVWLFRDYVISAFNNNKPFDQFTIEQLAGDLLPNARAEQRIASGYNRLLQTTEEGGAQAKEYTAKYAADRVRNTATIWLGLTMGCAECHDHKFDPITTRDFYRFEAFFADVREKAVGRQDQTPLPTPEQAAKIEDLNAKMAELQKEIDKPSPEIDAAQQKWEQEAKAGKVKNVPKPVAAILGIEAEKRTPQQKQALAAHYRSIAPELDAKRKQMSGLKSKKDGLLKNIPTTLVSMSDPPRMVRVLKRGNWLDDSGEPVKPQTPESLSPFKSAKPGAATRLDLANWMVSADNPLVARVFVNRLWKILFGQGIVKTLDDFGSQGAWPTHPELLDWLAVEFRESGWNVKKIIKRIVMSDAYRQSSRVDEKLMHADPYNQLLARQGRYRLEAEMVRDNTLAVSGLLVRKIGGPSAKPYQPPGYWAMLNFPTREWQNDRGEGLYRRGLYTYWCRSFLHPSLLAFDAPTREECTVERSRSNTPQQALVLLNDPTYVEAARALAERIMRQGGKDPAARLSYAYRQVLQRAPLPAETHLLEKLAAQHLAQYEKDKDAATKLLSVGAAPAPKDLDTAELAAWTSVARVLLNLHETITRN